ncbi:MAG: DUF262 domain-containing protein [Flavobacteriales bacterium]|nr:DUF262 domain-containing protein [Flavobacteriales bacterium]
MQTQKYSIQQPLIESLLAWVKEGEIAIPEIQRPFVWDKSKVRDLMDSIYQGFPVGYIITWKNPDVRLKDGTLGGGKKILIDGQQRITALRAALMDEYVVDQDYARIKIKIAFHPLEERFEVRTPIIEKDKAWLPDISMFFQSGFSLIKLNRDYTAANPDADPDKVETSLGQLANLAKRQIGVIELNHDLDIETVTEIFIRINSKGVVLSQADFAMSKIASNEQHGGPLLRKAIDYFCHLSREPQYYDHIQDHDPEFAATDHFRSMKWLKHETEDLYDPDYTDMLRVASGVEFGRGKMSDLVALLSGRDFEKRTYEEYIVQDSFERLDAGVTRFMNESDFKFFTLILRSAGFVHNKLMRSQNAINFAYLLYLHLRRQGMDRGDRLQSLVRRWYVMSILTERATGSFESRFDRDIKRLNERDAAEYLTEIEAGDLSDAFWNSVLPGHMESPVMSSPFFGLYLAAQVSHRDHGLFSRHLTIHDMLLTRGDIHHIFPRNLLKKHGMGRSLYNKLCNLTFMDQPGNIKIGDRSPGEYFSAVAAKIDRDVTRPGRIDGVRGLRDRNDLLENMQENCIPASIFTMDVDDYADFLAQRKGLMAQKIRRWYEGL